MDNFTEKISKLEKTNQENHLKQAKLEEKLKMVKEESEKVSKELTGLGVTIENIDSEIEKLKNDLESKIQTAEDILK